MRKEAKPEHIDGKLVNARSCENQSGKFWCGFETCILIEFQDVFHFHAVTVGNVFERRLWAGSFLFNYLREKTREEAGGSIEKTVAMTKRTALAFFFLLLSPPSQQTPFFLEKPTLVLLSRSKGIIMGCFWKWWKKHSYGNWLLFFSSSLAKRELTVIGKALKRNWTTHIIVYSQVVYSAFLRRSKGLVWSIFFSRS